MLSFVMRSDPEYLSSHADKAPEHDLSAARYYTSGVEHGEPAGIWLEEAGGAALLGQRGEVDPAVMTQVYGRLEDPQTGERLGTAPRNYADFETRFERLKAKHPDATPEQLAKLELQARKSGAEARTYGDLCDSLPKEWSVLHAALENAGRHDEAEQIWAAALDGTRAKIAYLQQECGYSRAGYHGRKVAGRTSGRWVEAKPWVVTLWRHHTSRDGDPQLHVHAAILNRVLCADGVWRSLDSNAINKARRAADAVGMAVAEHSLQRRLGVEFEMDDDGVRRIKGVDRDICELFSSRRHSIRAGVADLVEAYEAEHGRAPSKYTLRLMSEFVTLRTRARKPDHAMSREELLAKWRNSTEARLGKSLDRVLQAVRPQSGKVLEPQGFSARKIIARAIADVEASRETWTRQDLIAAMYPHMPSSLGDLSPAEVLAKFEALADEALGTGDVVNVVPPPLVDVPAELRREADGRSFFEPHRPERYTTPEQLRREDSLIAAGALKTAPAIDFDRAHERLGRTRLSGSQLDIGRQVLSSGRFVEVIEGAPGAGKSALMAELAKAWEDEFDRGTVGLATAEAAARVLRDEGLGRGLNIAKFFAAHEAIQAGKADDETRRQFGLSKGDLLIIDEASMVSTADLARIVAIARQSGVGKVIVSGDTQQLDAVETGGAMALLRDRYGAHELTEVRRFAAEWERAASIELRSGNDDVILEYDRHGRLRGGSEDDMLADAATAYLADHLVGRSSVLVVGTNEQASEVSAKVRETLVSLGRVSDDGVMLRDGINVAGTGDIIATRQNAYRLKDKTTGDEFEAINRQVWRVVQHHGDGSLSVEAQLHRDDDGRQHWGETRRLPAKYVAAHVELAYASTAHSVQGRTVDTSHYVLGRNASKSQALVAMTRGVHDNSAYIVVEGNEHYAGRLADVLKRNETRRSATQVIEDEYAALENLGRVGPEWQTLVHEAATERLQDLLVRAVGHDVAESIVADEASSALYRLMRSAESAGHDLDDIVVTAGRAKSFDNARSAGKVLYWRVEKELTKRTVDEAEKARDSAQHFEPKSYVDRTPQHDPTSPTEQYVRRLAEVMDKRAETLAKDVAEQHPQWAERLGRIPSDPLERAEWMERAAAVASYREQFGYAHETDAIGPAPGWGDPDGRTAWDQAARALGQSELERDAGRQTDAELYARIQDYDRELEWMPPNVDQQWREAEHTAREWENRATLQRAALDRQPNDDAAAKAAVRLADTEELARAAREEAQMLEVIATARSAAVAETQPIEERATQAKGELRARGLPLQQTDAHSPDLEHGRSASGLGDRAPDVEPDRSEQQPDELQPEPERTEEPEPRIDLEVELQRARAALRHIAAQRAQRAERANEVERNRQREWARHVDEPDRSVDYDYD